TREPCRPARWWRPRSQRCRRTRAHAACPCEATRALREQQPDRGGRLPSPSVAVCFPPRPFPMLVAMEGGFGFPLGGDPEDLLRGLREFAEHQAESVQEAQREQFATLTLNTAVELTAAALNQVQATGSSDEQTIALRDAMRVLFPEAVALVSAARQGFMREGS